MTDQKTAPDWLGFRTQAEVIDGLGALRGLFGHLGADLNLQHLPRGKDGFQRAAVVRVQDMVVGRVDFGGESQRGWVRWNVTGQGCSIVKDWDALSEVEALPASEIRRLDLALTTWCGEVTHETVVSAHASGRFCTGGRPPDLQQIVSSNPRAGRSCYVGKRDSDKFLRAYEKGFELAGKMGALASSVTHIDGCAIEDIYRCEVELKAKTKVIPWEAVDRRDQYFAGSYPFLADLLPGVETDILLNRPERAPQTELIAVLANCRQQYGNSLFTALACYGGDITALMDKIMGKEHNQNLLAAGVLLVEHDY